MVGQGTFFYLRNLSVVLLMQEASTRNSVNRSKLCMPHCTGSKPIREIVYEMGGKDGNPPNMTTIFFEIRKNGNELVEPKTVEIYAEIHELIQS
ncbi:hypothetical protein KY284_035985 [Solanum tuberosum]|nr:hypothetical protein KY284_035985 [Solanum tuberosum]